MKNEAIRVFVVDDHEGIREALRKLLELEEDMVVVGEAESADAMLASEMEKLAPHVILMDIRMPGISGLEATRRLKEAGTKSKIIIFTQLNKHLAHAAALGASAAIYKLAALERGTLANLIRRVVRGFYS